MNTKLALLIVVPVALILGIVGFFVVKGQSQIAQPSQMQAQQQANGNMPNAAPSVGAMNQLDDTTSLTSVDDITNDPALNQITSIEDTANTDLNTSGSGQ